MSSTIELVFLYLTGGINIMWAGGAHSELVASIVEGCSSYTRPPFCGWPQLTGMPFCYCKTCAIITIIATEIIHIHFFTFYLFLFILDFIFLGGFLFIPVS